MADERSPAARRREALAAPVRDLLLPERSLLQRTVGAAYERTRDRLGELVHGRGIETLGDSLQLEHFHRDRVPYDPSGWSFLPRVLSKRDVDADDVFVDFGSGKGRVVYQAARYPFARVVGVEISETLNAVARRNLERARKRLACQEIELVTADAAEFPVPDDMTVGYFFYPFSGETFRAVIGNIVESMDRSPRRVRLIYACPKLEDHILATGRFRLVRTVQARGFGVPGRREAVLRRVALYEST